ncbi:two-component system, LytTR family, sensor kinase [Tenacibaculum sp. 190524A02b]|uniref:Two-component system, LytTR family, sensor kinase n=1 Tax=Tenacibaculum vairaonense TaxID=3137860 RepID=A0ABP1FD63_9FLAO
MLGKKHGLFVLYTVYTFIISFSLIVFSILYGLVFSNHLIDGAPPLTKGLIFVILGVYFIVFIVIMLGLIRNHYKSALNNEDIKNKFLETQLRLKEQELKFLKMQIHPHFLFNTLNTLYGFALKKADEAPDMILKLSNLLDYILYQVEKPLVLLSAEIEHIEDYMALEKMRFQNNLEVSFKKEGVNKEVQIAPMMLLPFVENAFKHGVQLNGILKVGIYLIMEEGKIKFKISNSYKKELVKSKGIGLENIRKRLEMLYEKDFKLIIRRNEDVFDVQLEIPIKNE